MEILQSTPGVSQIRMYDERDHIGTHRDTPADETRLPKRCLYATLHCQLCRSAFRCSGIHFFQIAAAKLMTEHDSTWLCQGTLAEQTPKFPQNIFEELTGKADY